MKTKKKKKNLTRQWIMVQAAERLKKEEAYHQFVSGLSEDDYRLIRNKNLLGTPGEKTMEELQLLLEQAKENLAPQSNECNLGAEEESSCTEVLGENLSEESILQWINTFCHTGTSILSGQNRNQIWKALSQRSSDTGEFQFRLKINAHDEFQNSDSPREEFINRPYLHINRYQHQQVNRFQPSNSPAARQTRSKTSTVNTTMLGVMRGSRRQHPRERSSSWIGRLRNGAQEFRERFEHCHSGARPIQFTRHINAVFLREVHERNEYTRFQRHRIRNNSPLNSLRERFESLRLRPTQNSSSHSRLQRSIDIISRTQIEKKLKWSHHQHHRVQNEQEIGGTPQFSHSPALSRILSTTARSHPTLRLNLRVRILPEEETTQGNISSRTRSRFQGPRGTNRSNSGIFQLVISRSENNGSQICFRTTWLPLHGISEPEFRQPRVLQTLLQQVLAGLNTLNFSNETQAYLEAQRFNQHLWDINSELNNLNRIRAQREVNETQICYNNESHARQNSDVSNLIENIIIPILRLARAFLLSDDSWYCSGGLTNEEIDKFSTKSYENSINGEINKACSICVNTYTQGNKLRQLPCTHEFHVHCIDRWLAENNTCPICRQAVLDSNTV
uniref:RING-type E3 ubiquitin transferase n=1 Tax=Monodelphis domestica TaxID=13616 RepID=A0A5F8HCR9_MONDO